jgi:hypothetical protein
MRRSTLSSSSCPPRTVWWSGSNGSTGAWRRTTWCSSHPSTRTLTSLGGQRCVPGQPPNRRAARYCCASSRIVSVVARCAHSSMLARAVLPCMPTLLGDQFCRVPPIHAEPFAGVSSFHQCELGRMPDLHPGVLEGMPRTEDRPASEGGVCCLLVISDMPVGEQRVLGAVLAVQIPVGRQMLLRYPVVVLDVPTLDFCVLGCVLASGCRGGRRVRCVLLPHMITSPHGTASAGTLLSAVEDQEDAAPQMGRGTYQLREEIADAIENLQAAADRRDEDPQWYPRHACTPVACSAGSPNETPTLCSGRSRGRSSSRSGSVALVSCGAGRGGRSSGEHLRLPWPVRGMPRGVHGCRVGRWRCRSVRGAGFGRTRDPRRGSIARSWS